MHSSLLKRLYWACRRGMLELDLMLLPFLEHQFISLPLTEQQTFEALLHHTDPELYQWLIKRVTPHDPNIAALIQKIRTFVQTSNDTRPL